MPIRTIPYESLRNRKNHHLSSFAHSATPGRKVEMMERSREGDNHRYFNSGSRNPCVHCCDVANQFNAILLHIWWSRGLLTCFLESKSESSGLESISVGCFWNIINNHGNDWNSMYFIVFGASRANMAAVFWSKFASHLSSFTSLLSLLKFNGMWWEAPPKGSMSGSTPVL